MNVAVKTLNDVIYSLWESPSLNKPLICKERVRLWPLPLSISGRGGPSSSMPSLHSASGAVAPFTERCFGKHFNNATTIPPSTSRMPSVSDTFWAELERPAESRPASLWTENHPLVLIRTHSLSPRFIFKYWEHSRDHVGAARLKPSWLVGRFFVRTRSAWGRISF